MRALTAMGVVGMLGMLSGCAGFFVPLTTTTAATTPVTTGDYLYVANQTTVPSVSAFTVGTGTLAAISGSPFALSSGLAPSAIAVTRANSFVYVGGAGAIECFSIGTGGVLTLVNANAATAVADFVSFDLSYDGQWLLALDSISDVLYVYGINTSTGALTQTSAIPIAPLANAGTIVPRKVRIAPNNALIVASLGTGGDVVFTFNTTTGVPAQVANTGLVLAAGYQDNALAIDAASAYVYIARGGPTAGTSSLTGYALSTTGVLTQVGTGVATGDAPFSVLLENGGTYAYTANRSSSTVSGFTVAAGVLTAIAGSPFASGSTTNSLVEDNTHKYVAAVALGGSSDVTLYSFDGTTAGKLDQATTAANGSGTTGSLVGAATH